MKKLIVALIVGMAISGTANAATAFWTGQSHMAQSVTGQMVWNCEYMYAGNKFWRAFVGTCPMSVEVY
jgi:hypothetical protein